MLSFGTGIQQPITEQATKIVGKSIEQGLMAQFLEATSALITTEAIVVIACAIIATELIKQFVKGSLGIKLKIPPMENWSIRVWSIIWGVVFTALLTKDLNWKQVFVFGFLYGGSTSTVVWIIKRFILAKYAPKVNAKLSGQERRSKDKGYEPDRREDA